MKMNSLALVILMFLAFSCSKEKQAECPEELSELILGSFEVDSPDGIGIVTFKDDGTWLDPDNVL